MIKFLKVLSLFFQKEEKPSEHINLKVVGQDGQIVHFKIKKHTSLKKLINAYCERSVSLNILFESSLL